MIVIVSVERERNCSTDMVSDMQLLRDLLQYKNTAFIHNSRMVNLWSGHQNKKMFVHSMYVSVILRINDIT